MILGLGSDLAEVSRIRASRERFGERFLRRVYTQAELDYCLAKANAEERLAGRFAAKEAAMKALGTGLLGGITWHEFEVVRLPSGKPTMAFHGTAARIAERQGVRRAHVTITHTAELAMAVVVTED